MESAGSKLNVVFSIGFLSAFCDKMETARQTRNDHLLHEYFNLKSLLFKFTEHRRVLANDNQEVSDEMFNRAFADLLELPSLRALGIRNVENQIDVPKYIDVVCLLNNRNIIDKFAKQGVLASDCESMTTDYFAATLEWKYNLPIQIRGKDDKREDFNYETELGRYRIPSSRLVLLDPYLFTWTESTICKNVGGLITSLLPGNNSDGSENVNVTIITTIPERYTPPPGKQLLYAFQRQEKVKNMYAKLKQSLNHSPALVVSIICVDLMELRKEFNIQKNISTNGGEKTDSDLESLYLFCRDKIHDRWFFTNYYYCDSGRGFNIIEDFGISRYWTKLTLFSQLQEEHYLVRKKSEEMMASLFNFSNNPALARFFYRAG